MFVAGKEIPDQLHGALELINYMVLTQYTVWPMAGGLLDQDPLFLRRLNVYLRAKADEDKREEARKARKGKAGKK